MTSELIYCKQQLSSMEAATKQPGESAVINAMTVDVEDYFHVSAFEKNISQQDWHQLPLRVERNTFRLLELFEKHKSELARDWRELYSLSKENTNPSL